MAVLPMHYGANTKLFLFAEKMRKNPTPTEKIMWDILRKVPFKSYGFRRQHPIGKFIPDFYSHQLKLIVEVDGGYHLTREQREFDVFRDADMAEFAISILRFTDKDVLNNTSLIVEMIGRFIDQRAK
ncbi:MAG: hypothetical protein JWO03_1209 [Bacteroidetes bacterium]|nr:hypothetical protein [Bacteroidota bacterium]